MTPEELAAVIAAVELVWPVPVPALEPRPDQRPATPWRFSGRWWAAPGFVLRS